MVELVFWGWLLLRGVNDGALTRRIRVSALKPYGELMKKAGRISTLAGALRATEVEAT